MPSSFSTHKISWNIITYFQWFFLWDYGQHLHQILKTGACSSRPSEALSYTPTSLCLHHSSQTRQSCQLHHSSEAMDEAEGPKVPTSPTIASSKNKSRKRKSSKRRHTDKMRGWWQWMGKVPIQATKRCSHAYTHTHRLSLYLLSLPLIHTLSLSPSLFFPLTTLLL